MNPLQTVGNCSVKMIKLTDACRVAKLTFLIVLSENLNCHSVCFFQFTGGFRPVGLQIPASCARDAKQTEVRYLNNPSQSIKFL